MFLLDVSDEGDEALRSLRSVPHQHEEEQTQTKKEKSLLCEPVRDRRMRLHPDSSEVPLFFSFFIWPKLCIHEKKRLLWISWTCPSAVPYWQNSIPCGLIWQILTREKVEQEKTGD